MDSSPTKAKTRWPVYLVCVLLVAVTILFLVEFVTSTQSETSIPQTPQELTSDLYVQQVTVLLDDADATNGAILVEQYECIACHRLAVASNIAPGFVGIAERAATLRPPLTAPAYLYEAIVHPSAFVVEGYNTVMPQNYGERMSDQELGDVIAYLLTPDAH